MTIFPEWVEEWRKATHPTADVGQRMTSALYYVTIIMTLLWALSTPQFMLAALVIIAIHEGGHYFAAWATGIGVTTFTVGIGPVVTEKTVGSTKYVLRVLPMGGSVEPTIKNGPPLKRLIIDLAGPAANVVTAGAVIWATGMTVSTVGVLHDLMAVLPGVDAELDILSMGYADMFVYFSLLVAAFNMLPIPPLDGGQAVLDTISLHPKGKTWVEKIRGPLTLIGFLLILSLIFVSTC